MIDVEPSETVCDDYTVEINLNATRCGADQFRAAGSRSQGKDCSREGRI